MFIDRLRFGLVLSIISFLLLCFLMSVVTADGCCSFLKVLVCMCHVSNYSKLTKKFDTFLKHCLI